MTYNNTLSGKFISRPNRFIAEVDIDGEIHKCHVKNTGRCRELLIPGARVILEASDRQTRRTKYDLVAVYKGDALINIDSQAPNKVFGEWVKEQGFFGKTEVIKPEFCYGNSRFDYYIEAKGRKILAEIKGVTLEKDGVLLFPDAPTERGVKHLKELTEARNKGFECHVFFIIQMESCRYFTPNKETHPEFAEALKNAARCGVKIHALTCFVTENSLSVKDFAAVDLDE